MKRWQLTLGLGLSAVGAALIAPILLGLQPSRPTPQPIVVAPTSHVQSIELQFEPSSVAHQTAPTDFALVIDASGSMHTNQRMSEAKEATHKLIDTLQPQDTLSLISFEDRGHVLIRQQGAQSLEQMHFAVDTLLEGGGTNLYEGIQLGLEQLSDGSNSHRVMIVVSDGQPNIGVTDQQAFSQVAKAARSNGITVHTIGVGDEFERSFVATIASDGGGLSYTTNDSLQLTELVHQAAQRSMSKNTIVLQLKSGMHLQSVQGAFFEERHRTLVLHPNAGTSSITLTGEFQCALPQFSSMSEARLLDMHFVSRSPLVSQILKALDDGDRIFAKRQLVRLQRQLPDRHLPSPMAIDRNPAQVQQALLELVCDE